MGGRDTGVPIEWRISGKLRSVDAKRPYPVGGQGTGFLDTSQCPLRTNSLVIENLYPDSLKFHGTQKKPQTGGQN